MSTIAVVYSFLKFVHLLLNVCAELQNHENTQIYSRAVKILETYFGGEEESESEINPQIVASGGTQQYNFGAPQPGPGAPGAGGFHF